MMPHGVTLIRHAAPGQVHPDTLGTESFWAQPMHQMYAQMPFPDLFRGLQLNVWDERNSTLQHVAASQSAPSLLDYDLSQPGNQRAVGLHWPTLQRIDLLVAPTWSIHQAQRTLSHEFGHFYQHQCRLRLSGAEADDITRELTRCFGVLRPKQGHNIWEDWAEVFRAATGCNSTRGTYSDSKQANLDPELTSLMRCAYWLSLALQGQRIDSLQPGQGGCLYRLRTSAGWFGIGEVWRWRWIDANTFRSQEWTGTQWISI